MRSARAGRSWADARALAWATWLLLTGAALVPLRRYAVDNSLDAWLPHLQSRGPFRTYVVVGWPSGAVRDERSLAAALRAAPGVGLALDRHSVPPLLLTPEDFVVSRDGSYTGAFCFAASDFSDAALVRSVRGTVLAHEPGAVDRIAIGGPAAFKAALDEYSQRGLPLIVGAMLLVGALVLRWVTGSSLAALSAVAAVVMSQVVLLGLITWLGHAIDMSLSMVPPLMMALGFSYASHRALRRDVTGVLVVCGVTAAASVASGAVTPLVPLRLFGIYGTVGLGLVWLATAMLVPTARQRQPRTGWHRAVLRPLLRWAARPRPVLAVAIATAAMVAGVVALPRLLFESDPLRYFPRHARVRRDFDTLDRRLTGMLPFQVVVHGGADARRILEASAGVRKVIDISPLAPESGGRTFWCLSDNDALPRLMREQPAWDARAAQAGSTIEWRGVAAQLASAERAVRGNAVLAVPAMCLLGAAAAWLARREVRFVFVGAGAALVPVALMTAIIAMFRVPLGLPSLLIGAITVGLSLDDTLHLAVAARARPAGRAVLTCFRPCAGSSLASALRTATFVLSPLAPVRQFGLLVAVAILLGMLVNQLLVPHLVAGATTSRPARTASNASEPRRWLDARPSEVR
jgi:predicted RND superfamily exporter protein